MQRELNPAVLIAALVVTLAIVGWIGWRTLVPRASMSREEYIKARTTMRMEIIRRARGLPPEGR
jgi:hypothetical protein